MLAVTFYNIGIKCGRNETASIHPSLAANSSTYTFFSVKYPAQLHPRNTTIPVRTFISIDLILDIRAYVVTTVTNGTASCTS